jgi:hypothetical protein
LTNIAEVLPVLAEPGEEMKILLVKVFTDFDLDGHGFLSRKEIKLLFNLSCDKIGVERCTEWEIDYTISIVDDERDGTISLEDWLANYWMILQQLQKNKKLSRKEKAKTGGDFFRDELHKIHDCKDEGKAKWMVSLSEECRKYQKLLKKKLEEERLIEMDKHAPVLKYRNLDMVNNFSKEHAKKLVSLQGMLNMTSSHIQGLGDATPIGKSPQKSAIQGKTRNRDLNEELQLKNQIQDSEMIEGFCKSGQSRP